ncbi:MAG: MBL fold metallo-hydrolase [Candidatus Methanomethylicota archaeon]|uniref:MBL fold metallo-hydrolase n=1 Tax=Thermoproteota archaeon TaxID=2056631 RepID=A0A497F0A8_9CREN|nr:MAG: MBL fold metallo-hydrolase [Candidatus Verstraetearchaeota archaeon]
MSEHVEQAIITILIDDYAGYETQFLAQHGLSIHVKAKLSNGDEFNMLVDVGQQADPIIRNAEKLGIELANLDAILLTHCHYDHTGGLREIVEKARNATIIAHSQIFRKHYILKPKIRYVGVPYNARISELEKIGVKILLTNSPVEIAEGVFVSGEVERIKKPKLIESLVYEENGKLIQDQMLDDMSLIIKLKDKCAVITGCSHAEITNIVKHSQKVAGAKVTTIIGGLHLIDKSEDEVKEIVKELNELKIENAYVGHCTGWRAIATMWREAKFKVEVLHSGKKITLA